MLSQFPAVLDREVLKTGSGEASRLHPLVYLCFLICFVVAVFGANSVAKGLLLFLPVVALLLARKSPTPFRLRGLVVFGVTIFVLNLLFARDGTPIAAWGPFYVSDTSLRRAALSVLRFWNVVFSSAVFVAFIDVEGLITGFMQVGLSPRAAYTAMLALRFVPLFQQEYALVREAQIMKGIILQPRLRGLKRYIRQTFLPMVVLALSRVNDITIAMQIRCFGAYPRRTLFKKRPFRVGDLIACGMAVAGCVGIIVL